MPSSTSGIFGNNPVHFRHRPLRHRDTPLRRRANARAADLLIPQQPIRRVDDTNALRRDTGVKAVERDDRARK